MLVLGFCNRTGTSYTAICARCLQHVHGMEKSVFGFRYSKKEVPTQASGGLMSPDVFGSPIAAIDPQLYQEIVGTPCKHAFKRGGFCRYSGGMVGCGSYGEGQQYEYRNALVETLYRAYLRIPDKAIARENFELIDQLLPIGPPGSRERPVFQHPYEAEARPNEPLSILLRGVGLVDTADEWRKALDAVRAGGRPLDLLQDHAIVSSRLGHPDLHVRLQAIDELAMKNSPEAWTAVGTCLLDPLTRKHASERIIMARYIPLFDAVLESYSVARKGDAIRQDAVDLPEVFRYVIGLLKADEIRTLFQQQRAGADRIFLAAVREQYQFEFLDELIDLLNRRPSRAALDTIQHLLKGPYPFKAAPTLDGKSAKDPWAFLVANPNLKPFGGTRGGKEMCRIQQEVVALGIRREAANWSRLHDLYQSWIAKGGAEWWAAGFAQAMAEADRPRTLKFLEAELDPHGGMIITAALGGLGVIADAAMLPAIQEFKDRTKNFGFQTNSYYREFFDYALYQCQGIHRWRLLQKPDRSYVIEK